MKKIIPILLLLLLLFFIYGCAPNLELYHNLSTFKGIELYVWEADNQIFCGIMSGTNRNKTDAEIDYIKQHPATLEQMKSILKTYDNPDIIIVSNETSVSNDDILKTLGIE